MKELTNKRILITGACGTIGKELAKQLVTRVGIEELICLDNNETEL